MFDKIKTSWNNRKAKKKSLRVSKADLEENGAKIKRLMDDVQKSIVDILGQIKELDTTSEEGAEKKKELKELLEEKKKLYSDFQAQYDQNLASLERMKKLGKGDMVLNSVTVVGGIILSVIGIGMERESPKMMKIVEFILKPLRRPLKF